MFKPEGMMEEDSFLLLPAFWHGMLPFDKRKGVIDLINRDFLLPAVLQTLQQTFKIEPNQ
jgi:hypothetical protein